MQIPGIAVVVYSSGHHLAFELIHLADIGGSGRTVGVYPGNPDAISCASVHLIQDNIQPTIRIVIQIGSVARS